VIPQGAVVGHVLVADSAGMGGSRSSAFLKGPGKEMVQALPTGQFRLTALAGKFEQGPARCRFLDPEGGPWNGGPPGRHNPRGLVGAH